MDASSFLSLLILEIVLGIEDLIFIAILAGKLPPHQRDRARRIGLGLALGMRLVRLASKPLTAFVNERPTVVMLCLGFLLMIGFTLSAEASTPTRLRSLNRKMDLICSTAACRCSSWKNCSASRCRPRSFTPWPAWP